MADGQRSIVLRHVRKLRDMQALEELTDGQLLERFVSRREEAAFAVLVRRHGPLVLGVCRRVLQHWHAAEDAFQATFVVLFRRATSLDRRGSVANWLYTVAYHIALKARANAAQRRLRESEVVAMPHPETPPEEVWRDLQPVLDEELHALPEKYRAPIVLCYVEGKTNVEAARLLGWPIGTVKGRLARARQLLQKRLSRRGITLSSGLLGVVLGAHASAAVPGLLFDSTVQTITRLAAGKAMAGLAAAPAVALAEGALKAMFAAKLKIATAVLLAVGVVGMSVGRITQQVLAQRQNEPTTRVRSPSPPLAQGASRPLPQAGRTIPARPADAEDNRTMTITGRVLDAAGKPVAHADVAVLGRPKPRLRSRSEEEPPGMALGQGKTDRDGHFLLRVPPTSKERFRAVSVFARASGQALGWRDIDADLDHADAEIRLPRERILRGRLIDLQGQAAGNVTLHVVRMIGPAPERYAPLLRSDLPPGGLACLPGPVTTDAQGHFAMPGLAGTLTVTLELQDDRFARQELEISSANQDTRKEVIFALTPARVLEGTVVAAHTDKPIPNAHVSVQAHPRIQEYDRIYRAETRADNQGRFRVLLHVGNTSGTAPVPGPLPPPPPAASFTITVSPPAGTPYLALAEPFNWPRADLVQHTIQLALPAGVVVRGSVREAPSGKPVAGAHVDFEPFHDANPFYRREVWTPSVTSGPDGTFQLTVFPGPGHLLINGPTLDYVHVETSHRQLYGDSGSINWRFYPDALVPLNLKPDADPHEVTATLHRGITLSGRLVGPNGGPVTQAQMVCRSFIPHGYTLQTVRTREVNDGRFELPGCDPEKTTEVFFFDHQHQLGTVAALSGKDAGKPATITLQPCGTAKARMVREDGTPVADFHGFAALVVTPGIPLGDFWPPSKAATIKGPAADLAISWGRASIQNNNRFSNAQGWITFPSLIPGATYCLMRNVGLTNFKKEFKVAPGQILDLDDVIVPSRKDAVP